MDLVERRIEQAPATFRMSATERARLKQEAAGLGLTFQQLFELRMLGEVKPRRKEGRRPSPRQGELPLTG